MKTLRISYGAIIAGCLAANALMLLLSMIFHS